MSVRQLWRRLAPGFVALAAIGGVTMVYGTLGALGQKDLRRLAAYASVAI